MNWGLVIASTGALFNLGAGVGYALQRDWQRALYFLFGFCITVTVIWK